MLNKAVASLTLALALGATTAQLPAASGMVTDAPSEEVCKSRCCADMACCEKSPERTAPVAQPLTKSGLQQSVSVMPAIAAVALIMPPAADSAVFSSIEGRGHSPPPLALICIRLI